MFDKSAKKRDGSHDGGRWGGTFSSWASKEGQAASRIASRELASIEAQGIADGSTVESDSEGSRREGPAEVRGVDLKARIGTASFAFRGYDVTNLGRSPELLAHRAFGPTIRRQLDLASAVAAETLGRPFDLAARVEAREATSLSTFAEDLATIVAMELGQLEVLKEFFGVAVGEARQSFGYSLGEMAALVVGGVFTMEELLPVPLDFADDSAALAHDSTLGVIFSRGPAIALKDVQDLCTAVSSEGMGMVGVSSYLSPNTVLVIGQGRTLDRLDKMMPVYLPEKTMLRRKSHKLPPLHTPLVWQKNIPNRAAVRLYKIQGGHTPPKPKVVSCVSGWASYDALNARDTLIHWVDRPQLLWDAISETLVAGVDLIVHVGPAPNLIPATFERLSNNIDKQLGNKYFQMIGRGVGSGINKYAWLARMLPSRASLLKAPYVAHVILEDWLLDQPVA